MNFLSKINIRNFIFALTYKHLLSPFDACSQLIDLLEGVVHCETCPHRAGDAKMLHNRLCAVLTRADGDAEFVENHADVVIVCTFDVE